MTDKITAGNSYPPQGYAWFTVGVLGLAYVFSFVDRLILSLLVEPIKADMSLTDTQISLLQGLAFAILYTTLGIPFGRMVDKMSRVKIVAFGIGFWSIMTVGCGMAQQFWQLFLTRIGVGVGEATLSPAAYSIIADSFPKERLGAAMGVYNLGAALGGGLAMMIGGTVVAMVTGMGAIQVPLLGEIRPWQLTFFVVGLPGLILAAAIFFLREPPRHGNKSSTDNVDHVPWSDVIDFIKRNRMTLLFHHLGMGFLNLALLGTFSWLAVFFIRVHDWPMQKIGLVVGGALLIGGVVGLMGGGWLGDQVSKRYPNTGKLRVCCFAALVSVPFALLYPIVGNPWLAVVLYLFSYMAVAAPVANAAAILQEITPGRMRGVVSAFYLMFINLIGLLFGPTLVALATDYVFDGPTAIRYSLMLVIPICGALASLSFWLAWKPCRATMLGEVEILDLQPVTA